MSTDEVYGDLPHPDEGPQAHELLFSEATAYAPSSPYSASKASSDHLVGAWARTYVLPVLVSHCSNNYGPYQRPEKLIPLMAMNALEGKELPVYGDGNQIRDWLYVEDHIRALYAVATHGQVGQTYNISGGCEMRNIEVVELLCDLLQELVPEGEATSGNVSRSRDYRQLITYVQDRKGHDKRYAIDARKIGEGLGRTPQETFGSGLRKTLKWYLDNQEWCRRVTKQR